MINVIGSSPTPPSPLPVDPTLKKSSVVDQSPEATVVKSVNSLDNKSNNNKKKRKIPLKYILGGLALLLLIIGGAVSLYLTRVDQDLRQQASSGDYSETCGGWSASGCQGRDPGYICDNNPPGSGVCFELKGQSSPEKGIVCSCRRDDSTEVVPTPTDEPTLVCTQDVLECSDGSFVARDPDNGCEFESCPIAQVCTQDVLECSDGSFVARDPDEGCAFRSCPIDPDPTDEPGVGGGEDGEDGADGKDGEDGEDGDDFTGAALGDSSDEDIAQKGDQPELPEALPESGPEDWLTYLKVGLGTLGIGAILLLFL